MNIPDRIREVLHRGTIMTIATVDDGGVWASDVGMVVDQDMIYWQSFEHVRHSKAIEANPQVAATIRLTSKGEPELALQISGIAMKASGFREDLRNGRTWYRLEPEFIELHDEEHFGYEKQKVLWKKLKQSSSM